MIHPIKEHSKFLFLSLIAMIFIAPSMFAEVNTYKIDPVHSFVWFRVLHLNISPAYGAFSKISGTIRFDVDNPSSSSIEVIVDTTSVNTFNNTRDEHLRSADFFNVEQFPQSTFKSTSLEDLGNGRYRIKGDLSLLGITKPIEFEARLVGSGKGRNNEDRLGFEAVFTIKRSDFGMTKYLPSQIGDEVSITVGIEAEKI